MVAENGFVCVDFIIYVEIIELSLIKTSFIY